MAQVHDPAGFPVPLVGERAYQAAIGACRVGDGVQLLREPGNPYDERAIAAVCPRGKVIGYVGRDSFVQRAVHEEGKGCRAKILRLNPGPAGADRTATGVVLDVELVDGPLRERPFKA